MKKRLLIDLNTDIFGIKGAPIRYELVKKGIPTKEAGKIHLEYIDNASSLPGATNTNDGEPTTSTTTSTTTEVPT